MVGGGWDRLESIGKGLSSMLVLLEDRKGCQRLGLVRNDTKKPMFLIRV